MQKSQTSRGSETAVNILKLSDDFAINMDYVIKMSITEVDEKYGVMFKTSLVDRILSDQYMYEYEMSPLYETRDMAVKVLEGVHKEFDFKKINVAKEKSK